MTLDLFYWEMGDLYSEDLAAVKLEGHELFALEDGEWKPHSSWSFNHWTRLRDDVQLSDVAVGRRGQGAQVDMLLVDAHGYVLARESHSSLLTPYAQGLSLTLGLDLGDGRSFRPLARSRRDAAWRALQGEAKGREGRLIIAAPGVSLPDVREILPLGSLGPRQRLSELAV